MNNLKTDETEGFNIWNVHKERQKQDTIAAPAYKQKK